ncbi:MAG: DnaA/Hda family protein [Pseudomonadota bacterium]
MGRKDTSDTSNGDGPKRDPGAHAIWQATLADLKRRLSPADFDRYISGLKCILEMDGEMILAAASSHAADRINAQHKRMITRRWKVYDPRGRGLRIIAWDKDARLFDDMVTVDPFAGDADSDAPGADVQAPSSSVTGAREGFTFDTLVVGAFNEKVHDLMRHIADDGDMLERIVVISGLQGVGKTHLITALQQDIERRADGRSVVYITAEDFQNDYVSGAISRDTRALKAKLLAGDLVLIEDLQNIANAAGTDSEFARNLRSITEAGGLVILTADTAPGEMEGFSSRVMSQLRGAISLEVGAPDKNMRLAIVRRRAETLQGLAPAFQVSDAMVEMICARVRGQGRELCGALVSLYTEASMGRLAPTMDMLERVLDRQAGVKTAPSIDLIKRATASLFDVTKAELEGPRKLQRVVYARHLAMFLCREMTDKSYPTIARSFGKRDHTSIMYAVERVGFYLSTRPEAAQHLERLRELIYDMQA